jgi:hypothetical protein
MIADGRLRTLADLRSTYHKLVMQTHPDAVGSNRLLKKFLEFSDQYEEAKGYLPASANGHDSSREAASLNHRLEFFRQLHLIESLELPYAFHSEDNEERIRAAKQRALTELSEWRPDVVDLYARADADHVAIKREKPSGPYMKHAMALNVRPIVHNVVAFHLTGQQVYARQSRQNVIAIMEKLADQGWTSLHGFLTFMIEDLKNGAAVLGSGFDTEP